MGRSIMISNWFRVGPPVPSYLSGGSLSMGRLCQEVWLWNWDFFVLPLTQSRVKVPFDW